jgi:hypothetical protein
MARLGPIAPEAVHRCEVAALIDTGTLRRASCRPRSPRRWRGGAAARPGWPMVEGPQPT